MDKKIRRLVATALLAALTCVASMVIQVPSPTQGYVNLGDCFVLLSGFLLGPWYGGAAAGIGSMLTDLLMGYAHYAPGSLVIKGLDAMVASLIFKSLKKSNAGMVLGGVVGELLMAGGYFFYSGLILSKGLVAALSIPGNLVQGAFGLITACLLLKLSQRLGIYDKI